MAFYLYRQNNSGGSFDYIPGTISQCVIIEADSPAEADKRARDVGLYFDERYDIDCPCCGSRWDRASEYDASDEPQVYGSPVDDYSPGVRWLGDKPHVVVHYRDGTVTTHA